MRNVYYLGDARGIAEYLAPESVDLVFTDPVYENLDDYEWLGSTITRVLKPDRSVLMWCSTKKIHQVIPIVEAHGLTHQWTYAYVVPAKTHRLRGFHTFTWWTPLLWFTKGTHKPTWGPDTYIEDGILLSEEEYESTAHVSQRTPDGGYVWNKNIAYILRIIARFSRRGECVYDPFGGSGSVAVGCIRSGRNFISSEINPIVHADAVQRINNERTSFLIDNQPMEQHAFTS